MLKNCCCYFTNKKKEAFLLAVILNKNNIFVKKNKLFLLFKNQNSITIFVFLCFSNNRFAALWLSYKGGLYAFKIIAGEGLLKSCKDFKKEQYTRETKTFGLVALT